MSVEEARIICVVRSDDYAGWPDSHSEEGQLSRLEFQRSLDRLIDEVQAEMPCYEWDDCGAGAKFNDQPDTIAYYNAICPSCTARAKLAVEA